MLLTQAQVRQLVDISEETFRTWRDILPQLRRPKGKPSFTLGDVLALRILREMVTALGMKVSTVGPFGPDLFEICEDAIVSVEAPAQLKFGPTGFETVSGVLDVGIFDEPVMILPLRATIVALRAKLVSQGHEQAILPFPTLSE